jgi:hypothetical protein
MMAKPVHMPNAGSAETLQDSMSPCGTLAQSASALLHFAPGIMPCPVSFFPLSSCRE